MICSKNDNNLIFSHNSDFDGDGKPDNISFMIKRIKVHTNESLNDPKYRFPGNYGVEKFLEIFSGTQIAYKSYNLGIFTLYLSINKFKLN